MDKKTGIILGVIAAIVVVLVAVVFALDTNTVKLDKNTLIVVEGEEYTIQEFEKFAKIKNHENGDINKQMSEEETTTMLDEFLLRKIYLTAAKNHNISLESGDTTNISSDYDKDSDIYATANISKDDYTKYATEKALAQKLQYNIDDYYTVPDEMYEAIIDFLKEEYLYKTYGFRLMTIPYEVPESGDESGDVEDADKEAVESGDKEDLSREAQLAIAEDVRTRIISGESFEELAKEYGSTRLTFVGNEYTLVNGEIEYATAPLLESKLNNEDVYNAVLEMNSGDVSEIIEDEEYTSFTIVKLESVEEGYVGEGEKELKSVLLGQYANDIVSSDMHYEMNQAAYIRALYK